MRLKDKKNWKPVLNKETVARLDNQEMSSLKGGDENSLIFTWCICRTQFCTDICPNQELMANV